MYNELQSAYTQQQEELTQLRSINEINKKSIQQLSATEETNEKLRLQQKSASKEILDLQSKIEQLSASKNNNDASDVNITNDQSETVQKLSNEVQRLVCFILLELLCDYAIFYFFSLHISLQNASFDGIYINGYRMRIY